MQPNQTPQNHLATHPLTLRLKQLGATDDQLAGMRFWRNNRDFPFDQWSVTWANGTPPETIPLVKAYCAFRWLILDNPPYSRDKNDAWRYVSETMAAPIYTAGSNYLNAQRIRARLPRGKVTEDGLTLMQMVSRLTSRPESREASANDLWPKFKAELEDYGLDPEESLHQTDRKKDSYEYNFGNGRKKISRGRFANIVSNCRRAQISH